MEADGLAELLEHHEPTVIAAGGGEVLHPDSRERLCRPGVTAVWLDASPAFLASRVAPTPHRPLLQGDHSPREVLSRLHQHRAALYAEVADLTIDSKPLPHTPAPPKTQLAH